MPTNKQIVIGLLGLAVVVGSYYYWTTTGGAPSTTGGAPSTTGGAPSTTGGAPSTTGGTPSTTGGTPSTTGGTPSTTGGGGALGPTNPPPGYKWLTGTSGSSTDLGVVRTGQSLEQLAEYCNSRSDCVSFVPDGYFQSGLKPYNQWNPNVKGMYVKTSYSIPPNALPEPTAIVSGYKFFQNRLSLKGDLISKPELAGKIQESIDYCDSDANCLGFTSDGKFKSSIRTVGTWSVWSSNNSLAPDAGLYLKPTYSP